MHGTLLLLSSPPAASPLLSFWLLSRLSSPLIHSPLPPPRLSSPLSSSLLPSPHRDSGQATPAKGREEGGKRGRGESGKGKGLLSDLSLGLAPGLSIGPRSRSPPTAAASTAAMLPRSRRGWRLGRTSRREKQGPLFSVGKPTYLGSVRMATWYSESFRGDSLAT